MIRVAFTLIGGKNWTGGYNYLLNLVRALREHASDHVLPILFFGTDIDEVDASPFDHIDGVVVVRSDIFNQNRREERLLQALITGCDQAAASAFSAQRINVIFEPAQFYGWRFPIPAVAWIPDFQHRHLKHLFDFRAYWKRELGFRIQIYSGRHVMLSSEDARQDCERFYPHTRGRTHVVHFAVPAADSIDALTSRKVADAYGLPDVFFFLPNQFWKHKNHECVIQAIKILKARGKEIVVAASGKQVDPRDLEYFPTLQRLIKSSGLEGNLILLGLIPHAHIPALMRSCAGLINPSKFEGWSTTVEEAKAMGTPMILSSLKVHREQSADALFFNADKPEELAEILFDFKVKSNEIRLQMNMAGAHRASFAMKIFADKFFNMLKSIVNKI